MNLKRKRIHGIFILALFFGILIMYMPSSAKTSEWKQIDGSEAWERDEPKTSPYTTTHLYIDRNELWATHYYKETEGKHIKPTHNRIASWKMDESYQTLSIITVKRDIAYVQLSVHDYGKSSLYSVNIKSKKKKLVSKKFNAGPTTKNYIYADAVKISDTGAYPVNVWKVTNSSIKKVRTLGKYICGIREIGKHIYYGKYKSSSQKTVSVYRANLDGSHQKKLFTAKGKGKYTQTLLSSVTKNKIQVTSRSNTGEIFIFTYDMKTKKVKKTKYKY